MAEHTYEGRLGELAEAGRGAVLCGYSLGGRLALHAVVRDPGNYAGLVTVGVSAGIEEPVARAERARTDEKLAAWMETQPIDAIVDIWERQPLFADQSDVLVEAQRPGRLAQQPRDAGADPAHGEPGRAGAGVARAARAGPAGAGHRRRPRPALLRRRPADGA